MTIAINVMREQCRVADVCACAGTGWNMDTEYEHAQLHLQSTYLSLLAVDALMAFTGSVEKLTEIIVLEEGCVTQNTCEQTCFDCHANLSSSTIAFLVPGCLGHPGVVRCTSRCWEPSLPAFAGPGGVERIEVNVCRSLVSRNWSKMLSVFRELLSRSNGEAMILLLLKVIVALRFHCPVHVAVMYAVCLSN